MRATLEVFRKGTQFTLGAFVAVGWLALLFIGPLWPASYWYELHSITVTDEFTEDGHRVIEVDRLIKRNFRGDWRVESQYKLMSGRYTTIEVCNGSSRYRTDKDLPDPLTRRWWKGDQCRFEAPFNHFPAGTYRICTWVTIKPAWFPKKEIKRCSDDFERS